MPKLNAFHKHYQHFLMAQKHSVLLVQDYYISFKLTLLSDTQKEKKHLGTPKLFSTSFSKTDTAIFLIQIHFTQI